MPSGMTLRKKKPASADDAQDIDTIMSSTGATPTRAPSNKVKPASKRGKKKSTPALEPSINEQDEDDDDAHPTSKKRRTTKAKHKSTPSSSKQDKRSNSKAKSNSKSSSKEDKRQKSKAEKARRDLLTSALSFESAKTSSFVFPTTIYADTLAANNVKTIGYLMDSTTHNDIYPTIISIDTVTSVIRLVYNINGCRFTVDPTLSPPQCRKNKNSAPTKGHEQRGKNQVYTASFFTVAGKFQLVDEHPLANKSRVNTTVSVSTEVLNEVFGMDAEEYITKDNKAKKKIVEKLTKRVFLCAMKRALWAQQNTVTLSVLALKPVSPNDILSGHKFVDGAFVDIRKSIKQEPMDEGDSSASNASTNPKPKRKGKGKAKGKADHHDSDHDDEESSSGPEPDIISVDDDTDSARSSSSSDEEASASSSSSEEEASSSSDESSSDEED